MNLTPLERFQLASLLISLQIDASMRGNHSDAQKAEEWIDKLGGLPASRKQESEVA